MHEEIEQRKLKEGPLYLEIIRLRRQLIAPPNEDSIFQHDRIADQRHNQIYHAPNRGEGQANCQGRLQHRIGENVTPGCRTPVGNREHGHIGIIVIGAHEKRERPEMRWGPHEDQSKHQDRLDGDRARG